MLSITFKEKGTNSGQGCKGVPSECRDAKFHLLLSWHYLCRSLSVASASIVTILLAYNGFLYTQATGRLAKIILPSCLARWQFRNKLPVEARRRLLIIEASFTSCWPFVCFFFLLPLFSSPFQLFFNCCDSGKRTDCLGGNINPVLPKLPDANIKSYVYHHI